MIPLKILYKNKQFSGGAPKSLLQYINIAKRNNKEVVSVGEFNGLPTDYTSEDIKIINLPWFRIKKPFKNIIILIKYLKIIEIEAPDIIHTTTQENVYFDTIIEKVTGIPIIYNIPGGKINKKTPSIMGDRNILVYSEENKLDLIKYNYNPERVKVISNRMDFKLTNNSYSEKYKFNKNNNDELKLLLTSRMTSRHVNSIKYIMQITDRLIKEDMNVRLNILGDGEKFRKIQNIANKINENHSRKIINLHGFRDDVDKFIYDSHVVFGKGRSVIDGIANCRVSFVVNENDQLSHCNLKTFENLRTYNFTARNVQYPTSYEGFVEIIKSIKNNTFNLSYLKELKQVTREFYDISFAEEKIMKLYNDVEQTEKNYNPNLFLILKEYIKLYMKFIFLKFKLR